MNPNEFAELLRQHITISGDGNVVGKDNTIKVTKQAGGDYPIQISGTNVNLSLSELPRRIYKPDIPLQRPPRTEHFVGRKQEIAELMAELQPGRVITRCGPGGIGKTALTIEVLWQLAPDDEPPEAFPDGIIFYSFYNQPQAEYALEHIARSFGEEIGKGTRRDAAQRGLDGRKVLLILDGAEQADDLGKVLAVTGKCGILITTRQRKDAVSTWQNIEPLPIGEAVTLLQAWGGHHAQDKSVVRQICNLVGRLPLAIRLIGRYLAQQQEDAIDYLEWLSETPLKALDQGKPQLESMVLLLDKSLEQVSPPAQQVLAVAGILALSPFERKIVAYALDMPEPEVRPLLVELVNYSLLVRVKKRYQVSHPLVHTYARQQLQVTNEAVQRLGSYYNIFAQEQTQQAPWAQLEAERPHIIAVLAQLLKQKNYLNAKNLIVTFHNYLSLQSDSTELLHLPKSGVTVAPTLKDQYNEQAFLRVLGWVSHRLALMEPAIDFDTQALAVARQMSDKRGEAILLTSLAGVYSDLGKVKEAIDLYQQSLTISREIGYRVEEGYNLLNLGWAYYNLGQVAESIDFYKQALVIMVEFRDRSGESTSLNNLGNAYRKLGQIEKAIEHYEKALLIACEMNYREGEGNYLNSLGNAYYALGQLEKAIEYYEQALTIAREIYHHRGEGIRLANLGLAYSDLGIEKAIDYYEQAIVIAAEIGDRRGKAVRSWNLGQLYVESDPARAVALMSVRVTYEREIGHADADAHAERVADIEARLRSSE